MKRFKCKRTTHKGVTVKEAEARRHETACNKAFKPPRGWRWVEGKVGPTSQQVTVTHLGVGGGQEHFTLEDMG